MHHAPCASPPRGPSTAGRMRGDLPRPPMFYYSDGGQPVNNLNDDKESDVLTYPPLQVIVLQNTDRSKCRLDREIDRPKQDRLNALLSGTEANVDNDPTIVRARLMSALVDS
ncbi:hypothetical protein EVAR_28820_1 [Eumeta japonica]|uniref:Uncharacterized protein n=1 Tax=Eumeta variegata TaxID=151549 RepID=A0A4C1WJX8_EUMVA|nr:hypothetical protein EVAR_28820_1 [Eumeta japonica]